MTNPDTTNSTPANGAMDNPDMTGTGRPRATVIANPGNPEASALQAVAINPVANSAGISTADVANISTAGSGTTDVGAVGAVTSAGGGDRGGGAGVGSAGGGRVLGVASVTSFVAFLDMSVVNVAFPNMSASFPGTSLSTLSWVISGYAVLFAAVLTPVGRYADIVGRRAVFLWSLLGFTVFSALCAVAPNIDTLIAARALQGMAAGGMIPAALGLVLGSARPERRVAAVAAWAAAGSAAAAAGPALGGLLVWAFDWRAVFLINVPVGVLTLVPAWRWVSEQRLPAARRPDAVGAALVGLGVGGVVVGLTQGGSWGWTSASCLATTLGGLVVLGAGVLRARRHPEPALEVVLWANRKFAAAGGVSFFFGAAMYASLLAAPVFAMTVWHYSVWQAGLAGTPGAFTAALGAAIVGRAKHPDIARIATVVGCLIFAATGVLLALLLGAEHRFLAVWLPLGLCNGFAIGLVLTAVSSAAATSVPPAKFGSGYGMTLTARQLGGGLGIAGFAAVTTSVHTGWLDGLHAVFWLCGLVALPAAAAALAMADPRRVQTPDDAAENRSGVEV